MFVIFECLSFCVSFLFDRVCANNQEVPPPRSNWRAKHEDFVRTVKAARGVSVALASGGPLPPPPPPSLNPGKLLCLAITIKPVHNWAKSTAGSILREAGLMKFSTEFLAPKEVTFWLNSGPPLAINTLCILHTNYTTDSARRWSYGGNMQFCSLSQIYPSVCME